MIREIKKIIPSPILSFYHFFLAFLGALIYGFPSKKLTVIGVTGTEGKSTTVFLITKILEKAGLKVSSSSSISFKIGDKEETNKLKMTMPGRLKLQRFLRRAIKSGCQYAVLEVTSEGIAQYRHKFIDFDIVVFTNLFPEHIERHGGFEQYRKAKGQLFKENKKIHILNLDDDNAGYFLEFKAKEKWVYTINDFSQKEKKENLRQGFKVVAAKNIKSQENGISFNVGNLRFNLLLAGRFNVYNALAAISTAESIGIDLKVCKKALEEVKYIPGRMEVVVSKPFRIIVDYAHTPDSLKKVYKSITETKSTGSSLICVLGSCGGGRDKWKRPELGKIAARYCNKIILANEDPYDEEPEQILSMIKSGIFNSNFPSRNFYEILDRRRAIRKAISLAKDKDVVIITGKGSEPWMCMANGKKLSWDDRKIAIQEFNKAARLL